MNTTHYGRAFCCLLLVMFTIALAAPASSQATHTFRADCLCQNADKYINAQFYRKPALGDLKVGDLATISAGTCYDLTVCSEHKALIGTVTIRVNGWTENTYMVYKFDMHGTPSN
jgi:hypothetical protein